VLEHGPAHVEQHVLGHLADHHFLQVAGAVVDEDHDGEGYDRPGSTAVSAPAAMPLSMAKRMISGMAS
jgi:hypothetical protein